MSNKKFFGKALLLLPLFGMIITGCNNANNDQPYVPDYSDVGDEVPAPTPITIFDEGKDDTIFYSDDYFRHASTRYNPHLATLSIFMAKYSMNPGNPDNPDDTEWYEHQSDRVANFWTTIGFSEPRFNEDYYTKTSFDTIGIGAAYRKIKEGNNEFTVIASTVRSGGYFYEWENNVWLGDGSQSDMMHEGWYNAANRVIAFIGSYIQYLKTNNLLETTQIKLWLSGFSRGGAVMNITGGLLDNKLGMDDSKTRYQIYEGVSLKREDVLVYTFEAPQGANLNSKTVEAPRNELYYNIFNIVNPNDLVTKVAMSRYGFTRFGIDKFIVTEFFDPNAFEFDRQFVKALAHDYDSDYSWSADNFNTYGIDYTDILTDPNKIAQLLYWAVSDGDFPDFISEDNTKRNYDANIVIDILIDRAIDNMGSRDSYCRNFQTFARNLMHYMMPDCKGEEVLTWKQLVIMVAIQALGYVVLGPEAGLLVDLDLETITGCTSAQVGFALSIFGDVFLEYPTEVISIAKCISDVFHNHDTQLNVFHAQAQDSYYINYHNKTLSGDPIRLVKYRTNSEYVRFECKDINEAHIWVNDDKVIYVNEEDSQANAEHEISFTDFSSTKIYTCDSGFAVGTYSYATYHRMEVFVPSFYDFKYHFYDHSWKPWHLVQIFRWTYNTNENDNRTCRTIVDEYYNCDSDVFEENYEKDSDYETDLLADLTNTEWKFNITDITRHANIDKDVSFVSDDRSFSHIKGVVSGDNNDYFELYYDDIKVGEGNDYDKTMTWTDIDYCVIRFLGGDGSSDVDLIIWLYREAYQTNYQP